MLCHKAHETFLGSWTRFYCDCPFGVASNQCAAIFDESTAIASFDEESAKEKLS